MSELRERFRDAMTDLDLPDVDLVEAVLAATDGTVRHDPRRARGRSRQLIAACLVVALALGIVVAIAPARGAVARWFGIGATRIEIESPTTESPSDTDTNSDVAAEPTPPDRTDPQQVDVELIGPGPIPELGPPMAINDTGVARGRVYSWPSSPDFPAMRDERVGLLLSVRTIDGAVAVKVLSSDDRIDFVPVDFDGRVLSGLWIDATHEFLAAGSDAPVVAEHVLLWVDGDVQYRLESNLSQSDAVGLAATIDGRTDWLRPG